MVFPDFFFEVLQTIYLSHSFSIHISHISHISPSPRDPIGGPLDPPRAFLWIKSTLNGFCAKSSSASSPRGVPTVPGELRGTPGGTPGVREVTKKVKQQVSHDKHEHITTVYTKNIPKNSGNYLHM